MFKVCYAKFLSYLISKEASKELNILEVLNWIIKVIFFDIYSAIYGAFIGIRYDTIEKYLRIEE